MTTSYDWPDERQDLNMLRRIFQPFPWALPARKRRAEPARPRRDIHERMRQGPFGPVVRVAEDIEREILQQSNLGLGEVMAVDFEPNPAALPPAARWTADIRDLHGFEIVGQVEADTLDQLREILREAGVHMPRE
jgi:hypothetical protein